MKAAQLWLFLAIMLGGTVAFNVVQQSRAYPTDFEKSFAGTGLVEDIQQSGSRCTIKVALYDWLNLSQNYPLTEIPSRNDRFVIQGENELCNAALVASTAANGHIAFSAGNAKNNWYFKEKPIAGAGCGGYAISWQPEPEVQN